MRNLLLCFDAFGTLFRPRQPIFKQYNEVARLHGLTNIKDEDLAASFKKAFKSESATHPNYGKAVSLGSERWWTNVIEKTFSPFLRGASLPSSLALALLHRFSSRDGYEIFPDAFEYLKALNRNRRAAERRIVVGVITNSDDRVPGILASFGLEVHSLRHGSARPVALPSEDCDIDFAVMSYDVGHEKPDRRIFDAATALLSDLLCQEGQVDPDLGAWQKIYVGDEFEKDAFGAAKAGWDAILVDRDGEHKESGSARAPIDGHQVKVVSNFDALRSLTLPKDG